MRTLRHTIVSVVAFLWLAAMPLFAGNTNVTFIAGTGNTFGNNNFSIGPYTLTVGGQQVLMVCDDFQDEVSAGENWIANTSTVTGAMLGQYFNGSVFNPHATNPVFPSGFNEYEAVAWLSQQMMANLNNNYTLGAIQWAIWSLTDPGLSLSANGITGADALAVQNEIALALANYSSGNYSGMLIFTPTGNGSNGLPPQEFLLFTPEPATLGLLGTGLLAIALGLRKKLVT